MLVALRKESVDRNNFFQGLVGRGCWSLSARRAWIEISASGLHVPASGSLSARRAWIEIDLVSLIGAAADGRSPQGERG